MINIIIIYNKLDVCFNHLLTVVADFGKLISITRLTHKLSSHLVKLLTCQRLLTFTAAKALAMIGFTIIVN